MPTGPIDVKARVLANHHLSDDYNILALEAPAIAAPMRPGQFVMLRVATGAAPLLRRPFSIFERLRTNGRSVGISILNKRIGVGTSLLFDSCPGDAVDCLGPLGTWFNRPPPSTEAWMIAGGVGLAPFLTLAEALHDLQVKSTLFYGGRSSSDLFFIDRFEQLETQVVVTTEDGTRGDRGRVTVALERELSRLDDGRDVQLYACGPEAMLNAVARLASRFQRRCEVSVERVMGCGLGGCYSCVVAVRDRAVGSQYVRSCLHGPVFDSDEILWD